MSDPAFILPLKEVLEQPQVPFVRNVHLPVDEDWGTPYISALPNTQPANFTLIATSGGILAQAQLTIPWKALCSRCAEDISGQVEIDAQEFFHSPDTQAAAINQGDEEAEEWKIYQNEELNAELWLREEFILNLPLQPLCDPDCEGLCSQCGLPFAQLEEGHDHEEIDPRLAPLRELFSAVSEVPNGTENDK